ncbi:MAG: amino acid adenylation domain-containing protein, partial [Methylococcales bacterium]|nr:amino acid adenylation domain-containing protein [Methylococcales bacterium]
LKVGAAYVPMDPNYPQQRLQYLLEDSKTKLILTESNVLANLPVTTQQVICLDTDWSSIESAGCFLSDDVTANNLAYVIYTSGSTGQPKGVMVEHQNVSHLCQWHIEAMEVNARHRATQLASMAFDAAVWEIWPYLLCGASLTLVNHDDLLSPEKLIEFITQHKITHSFIPTPIAETLIKRKWPEDHALQFMLTGGDRLGNYPTENQRFSLVNNYGPTEATVVSTSIRLTDAGQRMTDMAVPPIGNAISNSEIYILDTDLNLVPQGVSGELCIGGAGLARGYLNRPELTEECFISHPFKGNAKLYKTGDSVRLLNDGIIEFLGRIDDQVKIRGFRIELGEIEAVLESIDNVAENIVITRADVHGQYQLIAYCVYVDADITTDCRQILADQLPDYMVPSAFIAMDALPLTTHGKVDKKALPEAQGFLTSKQPYVAPRDMAEEILVKIWSDILAVERIGIYDSFFELGGHSLLATQVISQIRQQFHVDIPLKPLFEKPTIASISDLIKQNGTTISHQMIEKADRQQPLVLSYAQERIWFLEQLESSGQANIIPGLLRLQGSLNLTVLEQTLQTIVQRHESLRTVFTNDNDQLCQSILTSEQWCLQQLNFASDKACEKAIIKQIKQPFDLTQDYLFRVVLLTVDDINDHCSLLIMMHHIIADGWSVVNLMTEVSVLYNAYLQQKDNPLAELDIQYADYA